MSLTYVIPDIHGRSDLLCDGMTAIADHCHGNSAIIVTIGDYVDKGPESKAVIDRLISGLDERFSLIPLKGNHDALMIDALRDTAKMPAWIAKGGDAALASYGGDPAHVPRAHIEWLERLRLMHVDEHRLYVHAGIDPEIPLDRQHEQTLLWKRYPKRFPAGYGKFHVVHGHDNCPDGPLLYEGRTNLDTAAWRTGRLTIGIFDDQTPGGPIDLIVVRGAAGR